MISDLSLPTSNKTEEYSDDSHLHYSKYLSMVFSYVKTPKPFFLRNTCWRSWNARDSCRALLVRALNRQTIISVFVMPNETKNWVQVAKVQCNRRCHQLLRFVALLTSNKVSTIENHNHVAIVHWLSLKAWQRFWCWLLVIDVSSLFLY